MRTTTLACTFALILLSPAAAQGITLAEGDSPSSLTVRQPGFRTAPPERRQDRNTAR